MTLLNGIMPLTTLSLNMHGEEMARMKRLYPDDFADLPESSDSPVMELAHAPNLTVAHQKLVALGFREFRP